MNITKLIVAGIIGGIAATGISVVAEKNRIKKTAPETPTTPAEVAESASETTPTVTPEPAVEAAEEEKPPKGGKKK